MSRDRHNPLLILTQGDPAGIGPEIALKAWMERLEVGVPAFAMVTDPAYIGQVAQSFGWQIPIEIVAAKDAAGVFSRALPVIPLSHAVNAEAGKADAANAPSVIESIEMAVSLVRDGHADAVVTNPISKHVLYEAGFTYPGHTEFLAALAGPVSGHSPHPVMMLWSKELAVVPVTVHIPLRDVATTLTTDLIVETGRIVARDLTERFGIPHPRLALAGLNPHAGEGGAMGSEDEAVIAPAIARLRAEGVNAVGPLPADTMFHARARKHFDAALAMYHDQALIPIKTLAFDEAVNITLGLPFIRTSPDHGTAFDIAGQGVARPDSLIAAMKLAARLSRKPQE